MNNSLITKPTEKSLSLPAERVPYPRICHVSRSNWEDIDHCGHGDDRYLKGTIGTAHGIVAVHCKGIAMNAIQKSTRLMVVHNGRSYWLEAPRHYDRTQLLAKARRFAAAVVRKAVEECHS